jgi:NADP-dependent 3-hydroxy acid dehydrogenase YdfG
LFVSVFSVGIPGGARGIGRATAAAFAAQGARVSIGDLDGDVAAETAAQIGAEPFALDVTDRESFAAFVEACGPVDVLVNNAGIMPAGRFLDEDDATTDAIFDVNVHGPITGMKLVLPQMIERGHGHVVNVASYAGRFEIPGLSTYCGSKAALVHFSNTVARELEGTGVTVTAVLPSAVHTELASGIPFPLARVAKVRPEEVAEVIVASIQAHPREVAVPRWLGGYQQMKALVPGRVEGLVRRGLGDDRAITRVDHAERAAYDERIARQVQR